MLAINKNARPEHRFKEKMSFNFEGKGFSVEGIKWIGDKSFIIKTFVTEKEADRSVKIFSYFKSIFE